MLPMFLTSLLTFEIVKKKKKKNHFHASSYIFIHQSALGEYKVRLELNQKNSVDLGTQVVQPKIGAS